MDEIGTVKGVAFILAPELKIGVLYKTPGERFGCEGRTFERETRCLFFQYDFLRTSADEIIGLRFDADTIEDLKEEVPERAYIEWNGGWVEVFFGEKRDYDRQRSSDGITSDTKLYLSEDGYFALYIDFWSEVHHGGNERREMLRLKSVEIEPV